MTGSLVEWLGARLDEDEQSAREGHIYSWHTRYCGNQPGSAMFGDCECDVPATVLSLVAAHRSILREHVDDERGYCSAPCIGGWDWAEGVDYEEWPCQTVRLVASVYAHRSGYLAEWGPT